MSEVRISRPSGTWTKPLATMWWGATSATHPVKYTDPAVARINPDSAKSVVDLPAPLAPSNVMILSALKI